MPRIPRGPIDVLAGYTIIDPDASGLPEQDYFVSGNYTIWGIGLITFGPPTAAQQAWIANPANYSDLSTFPSDWASFGFPLATTPLSLWQGATMVKNTILLTEQGIKDADSWSIGGLTGTGTFYWSDVSVTNGTSAGETLTGTNTAETLNGLGGDDTLNGLGGSDALHGGDGNDHLIGGAGVDRLWGDDGDDVLEPGSDAAFLYVGGNVNRAGVYFVDGGAGTDTLVLDYSTATKSQSISGDQILASPQVINVEQLSITGSQYADVLSGSSGDDKLFGGAGFDFLSGDAGNDWLDAGAAGGSSVAPITEGGHSNADALSLDHLFTAGSGDPSVTFSMTQTEAMVVGWGARPPAGNIYSFTVNAAGAQAHITYDFGFQGQLGLNAFTITDANGVAVDWYPYDPDTPIIFPHAGIYYLQVDYANQNPWDTATINVTLSLQGADVLASNVLEGGTGNDTYVVYAASDQVIENFGEGTDSVRSSFSYALGDNVENLTLTGAGAINATGNGLANVIVGNSAANLMTGGGGGDTLTGGAGADLFRFMALSDSAPAGADLITDFIGGKKGGDRMDLSAIDANANTLANDAFKLVNKFSGHAGELYSSYDKASGVTNVYLDVDGDRSADMIIHLTGHANLTAGDFIL
jgi:Ca2+-binding RTX toxin-like protein